ncbi:MAG: adenylyltransferase/cytidyltransferase family protein [Candidatus Peribacteraceae bacterium]|nr:adenylyltransferase/cytidyltransferase family protein [Candidatus Peribacteraceae bacterium]MDD5739247.1 adenylyltransferase/cytidyltransferase family protein [Candidatus Peribacteraceae bacterium]
MRVLLFGTFDRLHPGHKFIFAEAQKRGELTVIIARDVTVQRHKGKLPVQSEKERRAAVHHAVPSARVLLGDYDDYLRPVRENAPDLILLGYDQALPHGVKSEDLPCPVERLPAFHPERYKSRLQGND